MVSRIRKLLGLLLVLGLMCAALPGSGQASAPVAAPAVKAPPAPSTITPDGNPFNVFDAIWNTYGNRNLSWFRSGFINEVRVQSGSLAATYVELEWSGSMNQLTTLSGRSPLTEAVVRDGMYRYYVNELGYSRLSGTNMSMGVGMGLRWSGGSKFSPNGGGGGTVRAK